MQSVGKALERWPPEWLRTRCRGASTNASERAWWSIVAVDDEVAGVVLPVVFTGCVRDGLDEGTIYHIGVVADQRGQGLGNLLLGRATDTLLAHGVWQISCDTGFENEMMIRLFERHGWTRRPEVEVASS